MTRLPNGYWSKERVTFEILKIQNEKGDLSARYCLKNKGKLFKGALSSYGSWQKAIESAGIDYSTILKQKQWTKNEIINEILELKKQNIDLSNKNIKKIRKDLVQAAENNFGSWAKACISAGLNYYDDIAINKNKYWTKDKIIEEIKKLYNEGYELNSQSMQKSKYKDLFDAGKEKFGSWENAINYAGFNYLEISKLKAQTKSFKEKLHLELPKEKLEELYIKNGFSTIEIGLTYDVSPEVISNLLKKNKISLRKPKYGYNELIVCKDGHKVKSNFERNVDEWLFLNNIEHEYEPRISKERYFKADFKVGRFYIEILGMMEIPKYKKKFEEKLSHFMIIEGEGFIWCKGEDISKYKTLLNKNNKPVYILIIPNKKKLTNKEIEKQLGFLISK